MTTRAEEAGAKVEAILLQKGAEMSGSSLLRDHGWRENKPDQECWNFSHPEYPGVVAKLMFYDTGWSVMAIDLKTENSGGFDRYIGKFHPHQLLRGMNRKPIYKIEFTFKVKDEDAKEMGCVLKITKVEQHGDTDYFEVCYLDTRDGVEMLLPAMAGVVHCDLKPLGKPQKVRLTPENGRFIGRYVYLEAAKLEALAEGEKERNKVEARITRP